MTIGLIGAGKIGCALARGLLARGVVSSHELIGSTRAEASGLVFRALAPAPGLRWTSDNRQVLEESGLTLLAVKPAQLPALLDEISPASEGKLIVSLAAGVPLHRLIAALKPGARVVRAMPNLPLEIGHGATVYTPGGNVTATDLAQLETIFSAVGQTWAIEETALNAATALSGSGPAYLFHFIEALSRAGVREGLAPELSRGLARQTVYGAARLAAESTLSPLELAQRVKSPGGTTRAGCAILEAGDALDLLLAQTVHAARLRADELETGG